MKISSSVLLSSKTKSPRKTYEPPALNPVNKRQHTWVISNAQWMGAKDHEAKQ